MGIIAWIILGLIAGFIASLLVNGRGEGLIGDILLGVVGARVGGFIANAMGYHGVQTLDGYSLMIATFGAVIFLIVYHLITGTSGRGRPGGTGPVV